MSNYTSVLTMLLRLRQGELLSLGYANLLACDHPSLVTKSLVTDQDAIANQTANTTADESDDELADLLGGLAVAKEQKCDICFVVYVIAGDDELIRQSAGPDGKAVPRVCRDHARQAGTTRRSASLECQDSHADQTHYRGRRTQPEQGEDDRVFAVYQLPRPY